MILIMQILRHANIGYILSFLTLLCASCSSKTQYQSSKSRIIAGLLTSYYPNYIQNKAENRWEIKNYDSQTVKIFYYRDLTLYRIFYISETINRENGKVIGEPEKKYLFYNLLFSSQFESIYKFDSTDLQGGTLLKSKDSILASQPVLGFDADKMLKETNFSSISSENTSSGARDVYNVVNKRDTTMRGSVTFIFSRKELKNFPYSLGREWEKQKGMRLTEAIVTTYGRYVQPGNNYLSEAIIPKTLREITLTSEEEKEIKQIFHWATTSSLLKKDIGTGN